jgi:hypothetical protein
MFKFVVTDLFNHLSDLIDCIIELGRRADEPLAKKEAMLPAALTLSGSERTPMAVRRRHGHRQGYESLRLGGKFAIPASVTTAASHRALTPAGGELIVAR